MPRSTSWSTRSRTATEIHFNQDLTAWRKAVEKKLNYLHRLGVVLPPTISL